MLSKRWTVITPECLHCRLSKKENGAVEKHRTIAEKSYWQRLSRSNVPRSLAQRINTIALNGPMKVLVLVCLWTGKSTDF